MVTAVVRGGEWWLAAGEFQDRGHWGSEWRAGRGEPRWPVSHSVVRACLVAMSKPMRAVRASNVV